MKIEGRTVVITGASRGIGAATARVFANAGANVALLARGGDEIAAIAGEIGSRAIAIPCNVARYSDVERAMQVVAETFGPVDILIGNAGTIGPMAPIAETDPEEWGQTADVNLKGVYYGMRAVLPGMIAAGGGTIITVSSGAAHNAVQGWSAYCTSKAAAYMLTRSAHLEYGGQGVRVLGLSPGTVATEMQRVIKDSGVGPVAQLDWSVHIPPEWPARALLWMCSPDADAYLGTDVSLREETIRRAVGLIP